MPNSVGNTRAMGMIAVHNHPSGDPEPSWSDEMLTLIVAGPQIVSLAERGLV